MEKIDFVNGNYIERVRIGTLKLSLVNLGVTAEYLSHAVATGAGGYVCVTNVRTASLANRDAEYCKIQNLSLLTVPDGVPLVRYARMKCDVDVGRVCGPDLLDLLLKESAGKGYSHYFFGGEPDTLDMMRVKLKRRFPCLDIRGMVSPPFQPLEGFDLDSLAAEINRLKPTFLWVGLGAPKQERLMAMLQPKLNATISIGVGLAFDYLAGRVSRPPRWMQRAGLEWTYRLVQQPAKILRFARPALWFAWIYMQMRIHHGLARNK